MTVNIFFEGKYISASFTILISCLGAVNGIADTRLREMAATIATGNYNQETFQFLFSV